MYDWTNNTRRGAKTRFETILRKDLRERELIGMSKHG